MAKRVGVDKWLFGVVLLLVLFGLVLVFSASAVMAKSQFGSPYFFMIRQSIWAGFGMIALIILMRIDYRHYNNPKVVFPAIAVTMLLLVGVFASRDSHNTHRWFRFGGGLSFQPSELATPVAGGRPRTHGPHRRCGLAQGLAGADVANCDARVLLRSVFCVGRGEAVGQIVIVIARPSVAAAFPDLIVLVQNTARRSTVGRIDLHHEAVFVGVLP